MKAYTNKIKKIINNENVLIGIITTLLIILILLIIFPNMKIQVNQIPTAKIIEINGCEDCFDTNALADALIKENNINVKSRETLDYKSQEAIEIIDKYNINTIPALIILSKDIEKIEIDSEIFSINEDYALFDKSVPYIDLNSDELKGLVQFKEVQSDNCMTCAPLLKLKEYFEGTGVRIEDYQIIGSSSDEGKEIIEKNRLNFAPVLLISKDIEEYWWIFSQLKESLIEKENYYFIKNPLPPYEDLEDGKIKGEVDIIYIENKSCEDCFNASQLRNSFEGVGVYFKSEKYVDVSSAYGKSLLNKYNITAIPTVILSKDISDYNTIKELLGQTGTFEEDNSFVFRKLDSLNVKYQEI